MKVEGGAVCAKCALKVCPVNRLVHVVSYEQMRTSLLDGLKFTGELCTVIFKARDSMQHTLTDDLKDKIAEVLVEENVISTRIEFLGRSE